MTPVQVVHAQSWGGGIPFTKKNSKFVDLLQLPGNKAFHSNKISIFTIIIKCLKEGVHFLIYTKAFCGLMVALTGF